MMSVTILWGMAMAFFALVPVVGTAIVWAPAAVATFLSGSTVAAVVILVFGLAASFMDNVIRPFLVRGATAISSLWIFLAILGGIQTLGPSGVFLGPALLAVFVECIEIYREDFLGKLPQEAPLDQMPPPAQGSNPQAVIPG